MTIEKGNERCHAVEFPVKEKRIAADAWTTKERFALFR